MRVSRRGIGVSLAAGVAIAASLLAPPLALADTGLRAGAAAVDATWHVGASAGQYASDGTFVDPAEGTYDPTVHSYRRAASYGIQSRLSVRALVLEGSDGQPVAIVKNDFYIPQDLVYRRTAQLLEQRGDCGITRERLTMVVTHDHSSPMYQSSSWGVWLFQDVLDVRFFEYMAQRMFTAVERACDRLVPARVGAAVTDFDKTHRHSFGPALADDGTPAGYPNPNTDHELSLVRFDDISKPAHPKPLANLLNFGLHPEFLQGNDLISADYLAPLQRMVDRQTGAMTLWTQGAVGTSEPENSTYHSMHERLEFSHRDYAQAEYAAHLMSRRIVGLWRKVGAGSPPDPARSVPFRSSPVLAMSDRWYPGPFSHPYPGVSNCRVDKGLAGDPQLPIIGLPDCQGLAGGLGTLSDALGLPELPGADQVPAIDPGLSTADFKALGIPVPDNYSAPGYTGLEEDIDIHLQALRLGDILFTFCSCEQWYDQSENIETRTDRIVGNEHLGYDWGARCTQNGDGTYRADGAGTGTWTCPDPRNEAASLPPLGDLKLARMRAQVNNPANGWNDLSNVLTGESEPNDPRQIKGNYTHDDRCGPDALTPGDGACAPGQASASASLGYGLTVPVAMANDYNGYIATYREYQRGDHYRKALTGWGPHSSDYLASRLITMGRRLRNPAAPLPLDQIEEAPLAAKATLDTAINDLRATAIGNAGGTAIAAFEAALPDDGGAAEPVAQPANVERFGAARFAWNGGSNFTDNPVARVQRLTAGVKPRFARVRDWRDYADQSGELPVTLRFPQGADVASYLTGGQRWEWTAEFEAFVAAFDLGGRPRATPAGTYRFVVDGRRREDGTVAPYHLASRPFAVRPWSGIEVKGLRRDAGGRVSFRVGPRSRYRVGGEGSAVDIKGAGPPIEARIGPIDYPDSYDSTARFIRDRRTAFRDPAAPGDASRLEWYCFTCSFRPWLDAGDATRAVVRFTNVNTGKHVDARARRHDGRWVTGRKLRVGERAKVRRGAVQDKWADFNGAAAGPVGR